MLCLSVPCRCPRHLLVRPAEPNHPFIPVFATGFGQCPTEQRLHPRVRPWLDGLPWLAQLVRRLQGVRRQTASDQLLLGHHNLVPQMSDVLRLRRGVVQSDMQRLQVIQPIPGQGRSIGPLHYSLTCPKPARSNAVRPNCQNSSTSGWSKRDARKHSPRLASTIRWKPPASSRVNERPEATTRNLRRRGRLAADPNPPPSEALQAGPAR